MIFSLPSWHGSYDSAKDLLVDWIPLVEDHLKNE